MRLVIVIAAAGCSAAPARPEGEATLPRDLVRARIVAHRGASHEAPENTLAAFRRAWQLGVECVELDVRLSRDGVPVVIHDEDTERTTGQAGKVAEQTHAELAALDAGRWKAPAFAGERIPTLAAALASVPDGRTLFVELKTGPETAAAVAGVIRAGGAERVALQGYDAAALGALARELPRVPAFWTVDPPLDETDKEHPRPLPYPRSVVADAVAHGFTGLALFHGSVHDELVADAERAGLLLDVWTVNDADALARWHATDVRWIETDRPELAPGRRER